MIKGLKCMLFLGVIFTGISANAQQDANLLIQKVGAKINLVNNYVADGKMKTNVAFLKVPESIVKIYFKKPDRLKIKMNKRPIFLKLVRARTV